MINCNNCYSENLVKNGAIMRGKIKMVRLKCQDCESDTYMNHDTYVEINEDMEVEDKNYVRSDAFITNLQKSKKLVITSAVLGVPVEEDFLKALEHYTKGKDASLIVVPIKYKTDDIYPITESTAEKYYVENNFDYHSYKIMAALKLNASMEHPLAGLDPLSKGKSVVFAHPQVALKTVASDRDYPAIITTTGSVSSKTYSNTKQGIKANFNHSNSAIVLELDKNNDVHVRHLNFDGKGFYDLTHYYDANGVHKYSAQIEALITGDEHVMFNDETVVQATYLAKDSITNVLRPKTIVRHDVLDCYSISHHHKNNVFTKYAKYKSGYGSISNEITKTLTFIKNTTPEWAKTLVVASNHNDHLLRWLNECDPKIEPWNAETYHLLMYLMLKETSMGESGAEYPDPLELASRSYDIPNLEFLKRNESYMIQDVAVNSHGDVGQNGARGSRRQFSNLPTKTVIGHSHSPGIDKGCYQTGTSSKLRLEYNSGPSSWHHCHCIIYPNGKRQLIFIQNGNWKA